MLLTLCLEETAEKGNQFTTELWEKSKMTAQICDFISLDTSG